jgi:hypothetical protein
LDSRGQHGRRRRHVDLDLLDPAGLRDAHGRAVGIERVDRGDDAAAAVGQRQLVADGIWHDDGAEVAHDLRAELRAGAPADDADADVRLHGAAVDALAGDRVVDVGDRGEAGELVDRGALEAVRVAGVVGTLVVVADHRDRQRREVGGAQQLDPGLGMGPHDRHLLVGEAGGLVEHLRRHGELADVVHEQADAELAHAVAEAVVAATAAVVDPALAGPGAAGDQQAEHGDLDAVAVGVGVEGAEVVDVSAASGISSRSATSASATSASEATTESGSPAPLRSALRAGCSTAGGFP